MCRSSIIIGVIIKYLPIMYDPFLVLMAYRARSWKEWFRKNAVVFIVVYVPVCAGPPSLVLIQT